MRILLVMLIVLTSVVSARAEIADPFQTSGKPNRWDISTLTCSQLNTLIKEKNKNLFLVSIWLHGLASGIDKKAQPFYEGKNASLLLLAGTVCVAEPNKNVTVLNEFLKFKK